MKLNNNSDIQRFHFSGGNQFGQSLHRSYRTQTLARTYKHSHKHELREVYVRVFNRAEERKQNKIISRTGTHHFRTFLLLSEDICIPITVTSYDTQAHTFRKQSEVINIYVIERKSNKNGKNCSKKESHSAVMYSLFHIIDDLAIGCT